MFFLQYTNHIYNCIIILLTLSLLKGKATALLFVLLLATHASGWTWSGMIIKGLKLMGAGVVFAGVETGMDKITKTGQEQAVTIKVTSQASEKNDYGGYVAIVMLVVVGVVILMILIMLVIMLRDRKPRTARQTEEIPMGRI
jgi:hypothetical protein